MIKGTMNNYTKFSTKWGGVRKAYEGHEAPWMLTGGFKFPSLNVLPAKGNALPAFSPVYADEEARTIVPLYVFDVKAVEGTKVSVAKAEEGTRAKVGMKLIVTPADLTSAGSPATVTAIDDSASDVDVLTLSTSIGSVGGTLVEAGDDNKIKVVPNTLTPYDCFLDDNAYAMDCEACWGATSPILERRIVALPAVIKAALKDAGCVFRFSPRK
jgi:hypothetical protein